MSLCAHLRRTLTADAWANRETARAIAALDRPPQRALATFGHIVGAERLWLARLLGSKSPLAVWPELDPQRYAEELDALESGWEDFVADLDPEELEREVSYVNSKGESWSSTIEDILTHVALHSAYHRGQIASELRAAGASPAYTDYIHGARQGLFE
jgi:uncharacterized damage-inducible protein DinB